MTRNELTKAVIDACRTAYQSGLITGSSGNASFLWDDTIYITATGTNLGALTPADFATVARDGSVLSGVPSKELSAHRAPYNFQSDVASVFHLHGEYIAAYTCIAKPGDDDYPAVGSATPLKVSDRLPIVPYSHTNAKGDYDVFAPGAKSSAIFLQANHGAFVGGRSPGEALSRAVNLETNMRVYFIALSSGQSVTTLSMEQKETLFNRSYDTNLDKQHIAY